MSTIKISGKLQNMYDTMLQLSAGAHAHWDYACQMLALLDKHKNSYNVSTHFLIDTHLAHRDRMTQLLRRLYKKDKKILGIERFLKFLKERLLHVSDGSAREYLNLIDSDLATLNDKNLEQIHKNLRLIRNKKYSRTDLQNIIGQFPTDPKIGKPIVVTQREIQFLLEQTKDILSRYDHLFSKSFQDYLISPDVVKNVMKTLEPICFNLDKTSELV